MSRQVKLYQGKYYQGSLSDETARILLSLINDYEVVTSLKHCIRDVPEYLIMDIKREAEEYERTYGSLEGYVPSITQDLGVGTLRDAQTIGVAFMYYAGSALLGDEVGLGKTVQIAGLYNVLKKEYANRGKSFTLCFLTEKSAAGQVRDKLIQFTGEYIGLLESSEKNVVEQFLFANKNKWYYSFVGCHSLLNNPDFLVAAAKRPFDLIVIDESSVLKNSRSDIYQNCKSLFKYHDRKILLNATPLELTLRDLYNQLILLDPHFLPSVTEFESRYTKRKFNRMSGFKIVGYKNEEEFREAISLRYLARNRVELGAKYKDNKYQMVLVPLSNVQKELSKKTSLHQMVVDYPTGVDRKVPFTPETTPKLAVLLKILESVCVKKKNQALVYCRFVEAQEQMAQILRDRLGLKVVVLNGQPRSGGAKMRAEIVNAFNQGEYDVLITNVLRGIDLKTCDNCILYTIDPNPQKMVQFEGRITREFDVIGKSLWLLVAMGREKDFVEKTLKLRANASVSFTNAGKSMVITAIAGEDNKELLDVLNAET